MHGKPTQDSEKQENVFLWKPDADADKGKGPNSSLQPVHPFRTAKDLLKICKTQGKTMAQIVMENECVWVFVTFCQILF